MESGREREREREVGAKRESRRGENFPHSKLRTLIEIEILNNYVYFCKAFSRVY